jgi:UDP-N-acetylglucosamine--dolichyl-phosphate N-acetylglucosaminephosphotransferase
MDYFFALIPLLPSIYVLASPSSVRLHDWEASGWLWKSIGLSVGGYLLTTNLIPAVAELNKKAGLWGKDLGKKGTKLEDVQVPEALGIVCGTVFLVCAIVSQMMYSSGPGDMVIYNSALFSVCFMIFLGFTDDTLDLKWRYKLILPSVASLPLLSAYSGNTAMYVPPGIFRDLLWDPVGERMTMLGDVLNLVAVVDTEAKGAIVELGYLFLVFMGLLAVFCTNAINIMAGINGLEAGQSYVVGCSILFFKLYELTCSANGHSSIGDDGGASDHQQFAIVTMLPFIATTLALLKSNWFPAKVFVGDTFCYFAGMTFAVSGIHGHFSKTLLLLLLPQIFNFVISVPQVFKLVPCPRHRLPRADPKTGLLNVSTFPCKKDQYRWLKQRADAEECPNFTILCCVLRLMGPLSERALCLYLLAIQCLCSAFVFYLRYVLFEIPIH